LIHSLSNNSVLIKDKSVASVKLLGYKGKLEWKQTDDGLKISLPANAPSEIVSALEIKLK
jgi:hypothetical protein